MTKKEWLDAAEVFDYWRIVPRSILYGYAFLVGWVTYSLMQWYTHLPAGERTTEATSFGVAIFTAVTGFAPLIYKIYSANGRDLNATVAVASEETTITQSKTKPAKAK